MADVGRLEVDCRMGTQVCQELQSQIFVCEGVFKRKSRTDNWVRRKKVEHARMHEMQYTMMLQKVDLEIQHHRGQKL